MFTRHSIAMLIRWFSVAIVLVTIGGRISIVRAQEFVESINGGLTTETDVLELTTITPDIPTDQSINKQMCLCLPRNLCPEELINSSEVGKMEPCADQSSIRCCGVSSRSFIGMFGDLEPTTTAEATTEESENYTNAPEDSREMESTAEEITSTDATNVETHIMKVNPIKVENSRDSKNSDFQIPVEVIYTGNESPSDTNNPTNLKETRTSVEIVKESTVPVTTSAKRVRNKVLSSTPSSITLETTSKTVSYKYGDKKRRRGFRPASLQKHAEQTATKAEPEEIKVTNNARLGRHNELVSPTTARSTVRVNTPEKSLRLRLFNAENRLNYLRKKQSLIQAMPEDMSETTQQPEVSIVVPTPIPANRLVSQVDKQHKFMIEQVRFMLAQDTKRYPIVPIHSSFSTMAVASFMPKFAGESTRETNPETFDVLTEAPITTTTTEDVLRPFRGRKRYRFAVKRPNKLVSSTTEKAVETPSIKPETKFRRRHQRVSTTTTTTIGPNESNDLTDDLLSTSRRYKYQRRTRRINDSEVEFPSISSDQFSSWVEMFPPLWAATNEPSSTELSPTTPAPTFFQSLSNLLPNPFWRASEDHQSEDQTEETPISNNDRTGQHATEAISSELQPQLLPKLPDPDSKPTPFWTSTDDDGTSPDGGERNVRIIGGHLESSVSEASSASNRVEVASEHEPNFSGLITLNQDLVPWQIIGPIPKFHPPNDAEHIEFELPLDTREVVLI